MGCTLSNNGNSTGDTWSNIKDRYGKYQLSSTITNLHVQAITTGECVIDISLNNETVELSIRKLLKKVEKRLFGGCLVTGLLQQALHDAHHKQPQEQVPIQDPSHRLQTVHEVQEQEEALQTTGIGSDSPTSIEYLIESRHCRPLLLLVNEIRYIRDMLRLHRPSILGSTGNPTGTAPLLRELLEDILQALDRLTMCAACPSHRPSEKGQHRREGKGNYKANKACSEQGRIEDDADDEREDELDHDITHEVTDEALAALENEHLTQKEREQERIGDKGGHQFSGNNSPKGDRHSGHSSARNITNSHLTADFACGPVILTAIHSPRHGNRDSNAPPTLSIPIISGSSHSPPTTPQRQHSPYGSPNGTQGKRFQDDASTVSTLTMTTQGTNSSNTANSSRRGSLEGETTATIVAMNAARQAIIGGGGCNVVMIEESREEEEEEEDIIIIRAPHSRSGSVGYSPGHGYGDKKSSSPGATTVSSSSPAANAVNAATGAASSASTTSYYTSPLKLSLPLPLPSVGFSFTSRSVDSADRDREKNSLGSGSSHDTAGGKFSPRKDTAATATGHTPATAAGVHDPHIAVLSATRRITAMSNLTTISTDSYNYRDKDRDRGMERDGIPHMFLSPPPPPSVNTVGASPDRIHWQQYRRARGQSLNDGPILSSAMTPPQADQAGQGTNSQNRGSPGQPLSYQDYRQRLDQGLGPFPVHTPVFAQHGYQYTVPIEGSSPGAPDYRRKQPVAGLGAGAIGGSSTTHSHNKQRRGSDPGPSPIRAHSVGSTPTTKKKLIQTPKLKSLYSRSRSRSCSEDSTASSSSLTLAVYLNSISASSTSVKIITTSTTIGGITGSTTATAALADEKERVRLREMGLVPEAVSSLSMKALDALNCTSSVVGGAGGMHGMTASSGVQEDDGYASDETMGDYGFFAIDD